MALIACLLISQSGFKRSTLAAARKLLFHGLEPPDLGSQLEEILVEVWRQEEFERTHPFTCAVIREASCSRPVLDRV